MGWHWGRPPGVSWKLYLSGFAWFGLFVFINVLGRHYWVFVFYAALFVVAATIDLLSRSKVRAERYLFLTSTVLSQRNVNATKLWDRSRIGRLEIVRTYMYPRRVTLFRKWLILISWDNRVLDWTQIDGYSHEDMEQIATKVGIPMVGSFAEPITPQEFAARYPRGWPKYAPNTYSASVRWSQLGDILQRFPAAIATASPQPSPET